MGLCNICMQMARYGAQGMEMKQQECRALLAGLDKLESRMDSVESAIYALDCDSKGLALQLGITH